METSVDDIFKKIKQSEQRAQHRKSALHELKQNIYTIQEKVKVSEKECAELQKEYCNKLEELSKHENKVKVGDIQLGIYKQEREDLELQLKQLQSTNIEFADKLNEAKTQLCSDLESLIEGYGLRGNGKKLREEKREQDLGRLLEEENFLEKSIQEYKIKEEEVAILLKQKQDLHKQLKEVEDGKRRTQCEFNAEVEKTVLIQTEHKMTKDKLDNTLISIQHDVMREKDKATELEQKCCNLQKELQSLQQKNWQNKVQRKQTSHQGRCNTTKQSGQASTLTSAQTVSPQKSKPYFMKEDLEMVFSDSEDFDQSAVSDSRSQGEHLDYQPNNTIPSNTHKKIFRPSRN